MHANEMFDTPPSTVIYIYTHWQSIYKELQEKLGEKIIFTEDLPNEQSLSELMTNHQHGLLVIDDKMDQIMKNDFYIQLFTRISHHLGLSCALLVQQASLGGKVGSALAKNVHVNVLMKSDRERYFIRHLGILMADYKRLIAAYDDATKESFSYLVCDTHPKANSQYKYRACIFPDDEVHIVYKSGKEQ